MMTRGTSGAPGQPERCRLTDDRDRAAASRGRRCSSRSIEVRRVLSWSRKHEVELHARYRTRARRPACPGSHRRRRWCRRRSCTPVGHRPACAQMRRGVGRRWPSRQFDRDDALARGRRPRAMPQRAVAAVGRPARSASARVGPSRPAVVRGQRRHLRRRRSLIRNDFSSGEPVDGRRSRRRYRRRPERWASTYSTAAALRGRRRSGPVRGDVRGRRWPVRSERPPHATEREAHACQPIAGQRVPPTLRRGSALRRQRDPLDFPPMSASPRSTDRRGPGVTDDADSSRRGRPRPAVRRGTFPNPNRVASHGPAKVIAMCNQKGGVGKTTSTINLGAALAEYGRRVLLVDLDPQGALSAGLGVPHYELDHTIHNLLVEPRVSIDDVHDQDPRQRHGPGAQQHRPVGGRDPAGQRGRPRADAGPRAAPGAGPLRLRADRLPAVAGPAHGQRRWPARTASSSPPSASTSRCAAWRC